MSGNKKDNWTQYEKTMPSIPGIGLEGSLTNPVDLTQTHEDEVLLSPSVHSTTSAVESKPEEVTKVKVRRILYNNCILIESFLICSFCCHIGKD